MIRQQKNSINWLLLPLVRQKTNLCCRNFLSSPPQTPRQDQLLGLAPTLCEKQFPVLLTNNLPETVL